ncbi:rhodanese-like domain-containing protein [Gelidibacter salicanalis]|nr:rhodanese-like domain-containing protein [Gelidibacter salicanalis]
MHSQNDLAELLQQHNNHNVPYISVQELAMPKTNTIIFDTREFEEYQISRIANSIFVGYNTFDINQATLHLKDKHQAIVVYCSLGIRSEKIAQQLQKAGYTSVYNLYGGIFEWKNADFTIVDSDGYPTDNVHAYSEAWSKWLLKGTKVYGPILNKI